MSRFEVDEEVILKQRNVRIYQGIVISVMNIPPNPIFWPNIPYPIYRVDRRNRNRHRYALDNKDRCKYIAGFPFYRIYKLGEA